MEPEEHGSATAPGGLPGASGSSAANTLGEAAQGAKEVGTEIAKGAATGGLTGAAKGAAKGLLKSKAGRKTVGKTAAIIAAPLVIFGLIVAMMFATLMQGITAISGEQDMENKGSEYAIAAGIKSDDLKTIREVADHTRVPWSVLAAVYTMAKGNAPLATPGQPATGGGGAVTSVPSSIPGCTGTGQKDDPADKLQPYLHEVRQYIYNCFQTMDIGGYRSDPNAQDHAKGLALDVMISKIGSGDATGHTNGSIVAAWAQANCAALNCAYVIWEQHIWNPQRNAEGWRLMEDRGDPTQNHFDHVHISFQPGNGTYDLTKAPTNMGDVSKLGSAAGTGTVPGGSSGSGQIAAGAPADPNNICNLNDKMRPADMKNDKDWAATKKSLRECLTLVGNQYNGELVKQKDFHGDDIASGASLLNGKIVWTNLEKDRTIIKNAYLGAFKALHVNGADHDQWDQTAYDMALNWRLGLAAANCMIPQQPATAGGTFNLANIPAEAAGYKGEAVKKAAIILSVGKDLGFNDRDIQIAIMTAMGETDLGASSDYAKPNSDKDMGLFQERVMVGWHADGATEQENTKILLDDTYQAKVFYQGHTVGVTAKDGAGPKGYHIPGLTDVKNRDSMDPSAVANKVQVNTDANHYTKWWPKAQTMFAELMKGASSSTNPSTSTATPAPSANPIDNLSSNVTLGLTSSNTTSEENMGTTTVTSSDGQTLSLGKVELTNVAKVIAAYKTANGFANEQERERAMQIAVITMAVESNFRNVASKSVPESLSLPNDGVVPGDHDSVGLFQQRARTGAWGTAKQIMDPTYSALMFLGANPPGAPAGHAPGLLQIKGWQQKPMGEAAQAVQVSAFPDRYAAWETSAAKIIQAASGITVTSDLSAMGSCSSPTNGGVGAVGSIQAGDTYLPYWQQHGGAPGRDTGVDPWAFYWGECVSYAAWMVRTTTKHTDFVNNWHGAHFGNGGEWAAGARAAKIPVDTTPAVGSIATRTSGTWGHVAFVTAVNPDGTINVSEYNHAGHHIYGERKNVKWNSGGGDGFTYFIHFER